MVRCPDVKECQRAGKLLLVRGVMQTDGQTWDTWVKIAGPSLISSSLI